MDVDEYNLMMKLSELLTDKVGLEELMCDDKEDGDMSFDDVFANV